jgi:hypothetical protein
MELNRTHQLHVYIIGDNFFLLSYCLAWNNYAVQGITYFSS